MDKLNAIKAFVRVVEAGTFTKAADSLDLPRTQVTRLVQALEEELRTRLLNRTTRSVTVTPEGAAYYDRVARILDDLADAESGMLHAQGHPSGKLRINVMAPIADLILIPALDEFCSLYPGIDLDIGVSDRQVDLISENVDCVLRSGQIADPSLVARRVGRIPRLLCASPTYLQRCGIPQQPRDLEVEPHRLITYFLRGSVRATYVLTRGDQRCELTNARSVIAVNDVGSMLSAGLAGLGVAFTAPFMVAPHLAAGRLQIVLPGWTFGVTPLYIVYPSNRHISAKLRVFIDWVSELLGRMLTVQPIT